jgi:pimeloyl-ACP methyl ester carboxylesterase
MTRILLIAIAVIWNSSAYAQAQRPLVVIPGILGSSLGDEKCERLTWGDRSSLWRLDELRLGTDGRETVRSHRPCGLIGTVQVVGPLKIDAYSDLLTTLGGMGYRSGENLFLFPYDWRRSNFESAKKLKEMLDSPPFASQQVDILAHSMGGVVARIYIQELGGVAKVNRLVTMGTPHLGSAEMLNVMDDGWGFWRNLAAGGLGNVRRTILTFPAIYELMPYYPNCCAVGMPGAEGTHEVSPFDRNFWKSMPWVTAVFPIEVSDAFLMRTLQNALRVKEVMLEEMPSSINFFPLCTGIFDTAWRVYWDAVTGRIARRDTDKGDGTVHIRSAANGRLSQCRASTSEHKTIFAGDAAHEQLEWILRPDLHDFQPKAGIDQTGIAFRVDTVDRARLRVAKVGLQVDPAAVRVATDFTVQVGLFGEAALVNATIAATVHLPATNSTSSLTRTNCVGSISEAQLCLSGTLRAPTEPGPERFEVKLPGVDPFNDVLLVL